MKHHYLPVFYLRAWAHKYSGKLVEFSRIGGSVKPLRRSPAGTGYLKDLYQIRGAPVESKHVFETDFLRIIDNRASVVAQRLIGGCKGLSLRDKGFWAHFLLSIMARSPESVATLNDVFSAVMSEKQGIFEDEINRLAALDPSYQPRPLVDTMPEEACKATLSLIKTMSIQDDVARMMVEKMHWFCINFDKSCPGLLTSDRPILRSNGLLKPDSQILMPLSPRILFCAFKNSHLAEVVQNSDRRKINAEVNSWIVRQAVQYVYGETDASLRFVDKQIGTARLDLYVDYRKLFAEL